MDLKEILKNQGYTDEQIRKIMDAMKENGIHTSSAEDPDETIRQLREDNERLKAESEKPRPEKEDPSAGETIRQLQEEIRRGRIETAAIIGLTKAGAMDVDYLMYKAEKSGELRKLKIGEDGKVTGAEEFVNGLKKTHAAQFADPEKAPGVPVRTGIKKLEETGMPDEETGTLEEAIAWELSQENR